MRFAFTTQQLEFRDAVSQLLERECTTEALRSAFEAPDPRGERWSALAEMGVVGMLVPDHLGGLGLGLVDLVPILEAAGRAGLPEPIGDTAGVAVLALRSALERSGDGTVAGVLEAVASGEATVAVATGDRRPTPYAQGATHVIADGAARGALSLVDAAACTVEPVRSLDPTRLLGTVDVAEPASAVPLADGDDPGALRALCDHGALTAAAQLVGLADRTIGITADYARERRQFGVPIGSFQAVKHHLANAQVLLEFARPLVYAAAWAADRHEADAHRLACAAKSKASDAASKAAEIGLQVHGAIGYTWECDVHLFLKRIWALSVDWGDAPSQRAALLDDLTAQCDGAGGAGE